MNIIIYSFWFNWLKSKSTNWFNKLVILLSIFYSNIKDTIGIKETTDIALNAEENKEDKIKKNNVNLRLRICFIIICSAYIFIKISLI